MLGHLGPWSPGSPATEVLGLLGAHTTSTPRPPRSLPASAGYLSSCPTPVTSPTETVATLGSCLYISCRYDLCQAGPEAQLRNLTWVQHPTYDEKGKEFRGRKVAELHGTPGTNRSDCSLLLPRIRGGDAGVYGLRLAADPSQRPYGELRWMHRVTVNVTGRATPLTPNPVTPRGPTRFSIIVTPHGPTRFSIIITPLTPIPVVPPGSPSSSSSP